MYELKNDKNSRKRVYEMVQRPSRQPTSIHVHRKVVPKLPTALTEPKCFSTIAGLVRLSAGAMIPIALSFIIERRRFLSKVKPVVHTIDNPQPSTLRSRFQSDAGRKPSESFTMFQQTSTEKDEDPQFKIVLRLRKEWDEMVGKYKSEVEGKMKNKGMKKEKKEKKKGKKGSGSGKDKNKKTGKKGKKGKGKGKQGEKEEIDWVWFLFSRFEAYFFLQIQLLPIWVVKNIFSYLDKKTLQKIKKVNHYWDFVATDMLKEIAMRKSLNNTIKKMEVT